MSGVDTVEAEVRELVRRRGLDPVEDRLAVRRLVDEVVAEYDERALTSTLPPLPDARSAARSVYDAVAGYGPLQRHLDDPEVEEIWVNSPRQRFHSSEAYGATSVRTESAAAPRTRSVRVAAPARVRSSAEGHRWE